MASTVADILTSARFRLNEVVPRFWGDDELTDIINAGVKDLWRDTVNLKQEHFLTVATTVTMAASTSTLSSVPTDVYKIVNIEPLNMLESSANQGLIFRPKEYNSNEFKSARSLDPIDPQSATIYYDITGAGAPVGAPTIRVAPQVTSAVSLSVAYVPTLTILNDQSDSIPIPGESDNALVAWTVAYARAKEREDRAPDSNWLAIYATEKQHLLESFGVRQFQEPTVVDAFFEDYWG